MIDTAQLRELREALSYVGGPRWGFAEAANMMAVVKAAKERLTQMEAGALIITPDENGAWPKWTAKVRIVATWDYDCFGDVALDALRDAMPDGET